MNTHSQRTATSVSPAIQSGDYSDQIWVVTCWPTDGGILHAICANTEEVKLVVQQYYTLEGFTEDLYRIDEVPSDWSCDETENCLPASN